ncbi:hypothetical protein FRB94_014033 [Tulasnella sp. JGI-2019a]|nr:hypothetical protein FRB94_014033 [Tulasnella sp. JGI-2019a]
MSAHTRSRSRITPVSSPAPSRPPSPPSAGPLDIETTPRQNRPLRRAPFSPSPVSADHTRQDAVVRTGGTRTLRAASRGRTYTPEAHKDENEVYQSDGADGWDGESYDPATKSKTGKGGKAKRPEISSATMEINKTVNMMLPEKHRTLVMNKLKELWRTILTQPAHTIFSNVTSADLSSINCGRQFAVPVPGFEEDVVKDSTITDELDIPMMRKFLQDALACRNHESETACRALIDFIIINVVAKLNKQYDELEDAIGLENPCMIVSEHAIQSEEFPTKDGGTRSFSGIVDYLFAVMPSSAADAFKENASGVLENHAELRSPDYCGRVNIIEAKTGKLDSHLPQAVMQAATYCRKRGYVVETHSSRETVMLTLLHLNQVEELESMFI